MAESKSTVSRRSFLAAVGAAGAAAAVPVSAGAGALAWRDAAGSLSVLREAYLAEVERFAEELAPRFAAGELRAFADCDAEADTPCDGPREALEALCGERFGCRVVRVEHDSYHTFDGPVSGSLLVLAASPHAEATDGDFYHVAQWAQEAAAWDVIVVARARGYYEMAPGELERPEGMTR